MWLQMYLKKWKCECILEEWFFGWIFWSICRGVSHTPELSECGRMREGVCDTPLRFSAIQMGVCDTPPTFQ